MWINRVAGQVRENKRNISSLTDSIEKFRTEVKENFADGKREMEQLQDKADQQVKSLGKATESLAFIRGKLEKSGTA